MENARVLVRSSLVHVLSTPLSWRHELRVSFKHARLGVSARLKKIPTPRPFLLSAI